MCEARGLTVGGEGAAQGKAVSDLDVCHELDASLFS
jgi:hypothetical protein